MLLAAIAGAIFGGLLLVEQPIARWCVGENCPADILYGLNAAEPFGTALGLAVATVLIFVLDPRRRRLIGRLLWMAIAAGMSANLVKILVSRQRPKFFDFSGSIADTFGPLLPLTELGKQWQSFPSAHTAMAFGLALGLSWLYPRGRVVFLAWAALVGVQRVATGYHFPSDVFCGALLGIGVGWLCTRHPAVTAWFAWGERRLYGPPREERTDGSRLKSAPASRAA